MSNKTSEVAKYSLDKAKALEDGDINILNELSKKGSMLNVMVAAKLLIIPSTASQILRNLQKKGLVTSVQSDKKEIVANDGEEYFALSAEGRDMMNILPIVEKM